MKIGKLLENYISLVILQGANYILPLITFPYLVRVLSIEKYGNVVYAFALIQYFVILSAYGFNLYAPREIALNQENRRKINELFSSVIIIKICISLIGFIILSLLLKFIPMLNKNYKIYLFTYGIVFGQAILPIWFFQGIEKMKMITIINLTSRIIYAMSIFTFIKKESDFIMVPVYNSIGYVFAGILGIFLSFRYFKVEFIIPKSSIILSHLKGSFTFFLSRISLSIYTISNTFVIGTFGNMELAGIYGIAERLFNAIQGFYHPLVNALYPFITKEKKIKLFKKIFNLAIFGNLILLLIIYIATPSIFRVLFNETNILTMQTFRVLLIACIFIVPSILLGYPFLAALGHPKFANMSVIISSFIHLSLLIILVISDNVNLHLISSVIIITEVSVLVIRIWGTKKYNLWKSNE